MVSNGANGSERNIYEGRGRDPFILNTEGRWKRLKRLTTGTRIETRNVQGELLNAMLTQQGIALQEETQGHEQIIVVG